MAASGGEGEQRFIYVTDDVEHRVWRLALPMMEFQLVCGSVAGFKDGPGSAAQLKGPSGIAVYGEWLYFADELNHAVRGVDLKSFEVSTVAGNGISGYEDGVGDLARFRNPRGIAVGAAGGVVGGRLTIYVAESMNHCVRAIDVSHPLRRVALIMKSKSETLNCVRHFLLAKTFASKENQTIIILEQKPMPRHIIEGGS